MNVQRLAYTIIIMASGFIRAGVSVFDGPIIFSFRASILGSGLL